ncbi:MAG: protein-L-isoaspartate(D-aspartate) O-methyltransferase [Candidatus Scalindua rubra]|uniref:Protein-L-isoaspartate O-methyltransferase n=1 Tax=Candidatus Scalindua brodae TaxID=237368 RepID=A0A0B0EKG7_9BACT|nr:MAG: protein-L-isoaspartate O-methyltransferase [Candidatus Scalindua brodae]MBZ0110135.1 protein-L-isoaspartate(D-aspartate) O-methyltransferase [Candidatus Scalindua rubra]
MKFSALIIIVIVISCIFYSFRPFINKGDISIVNGKEAKSTEDDYAQQREMMVEQQIVARGIKSKKVLDAMNSVPRHLFVPVRYRRGSYFDQPLPIGLEQTISQPYIVALMTELLDVDNEDIVLEIGTGSGYQAAVLSTIVKKLYTIEIIEELGIQAAERLKSLEYDNVEVKISDGGIGWSEKAPFDAIIVTAAAPKIPDPLIKQLKPGGRMVVPVDNNYYSQDLLIVEKDETGNIKTTKTIPVRFVPLVEGEKSAK